MMLRAENDVTIYNPYLQVVGQMFTAAGSGFLGRTRTTIGIEVIEGSG